jgi:hypothetical protein
MRAFVIVDSLNLRYGISQWFLSEEYHSIKLVLPRNEWNKDKEEKRFKIPKRKFGHP